MGNFGVTEILIVVGVIVALFGIPRRSKLRRRASDKMAKTKDAVGSVKGDFLSGLREEPPPAVAREPVVHAEASGGRAARLLRRLRPFGRSRYGARRRAPCPRSQIGASLVAVPPLPPSTFTKRCAIRGSDLDASHPAGSEPFVSPVAYLTYLEETRDEWFLEVLGIGLLLNDFVLGRCAVDYRQLLHREDGHVDVEVRCTRVGTASVTMADRVTSARDGRLVAEAESVVVHIDRTTGKSRPLTDQIRTAFNRWLL